MEVGGSDEGLDATFVAEVETPLTGWGEVDLIGGGGNGTGAREGPVPEGADDAEEAFAEGDPPDLPNTNSGMTNPATKAANNTTNSIKGNTNDIAPSVGAVFPFVTAQEAGVLRPPKIGPT